MKFTQQIPTTSPSIIIPPNPPIKLFYRLFNSRGSIRFISLAFSSMSFKSAGMTAFSSDNLKGTKSLRFLLLPPFPFPRGDPSSKSRIVFLTGVSSVHRKTRKFSRFRNFHLFPPSETQFHLFPPFSHGVRSPSNQFSRFESFPSKKKLPPWQQKPLFPA